MHNVYVDSTVDRLTTQLLLLNHHIVTVGDQQWFGSISEEAAVTFRLETKVIRERGHHRQLYVSNFHQ